MKETAAATSREVLVVAKPMAVVVVVVVVVVDECSRRCKRSSVSVNDKRTQCLCCLWSKKNETDSVQVYE
jgi:hypothetical protein